jgi:hypothetical protein
MEGFRRDAVSCRQRAVVFARYLRAGGVPVLLNPFADGSVFVPDSKPGYNWASL